ncbi:hypothetical protein [Pelomonas cellulosilytica]|uniref:ABC transporter ATP-binding protein n=1 Tax=Pelomonas cellulosilytica TaxID=2906762 RepID=A0ABS8XXV5_9BURK|nr:hypothetical protein [Pelomonas sp. P8]MCE4555554.1 hypothetical protein [Pelomonas sp. P8]
MSETSSFASNPPSVQIQTFRLNRVFDVKRDPIAREPATAPSPFICPARLAWRLETL